MKNVVCDLCFHHCVLKEGQRGFCRARIVKHGKIICENYGKITSLALDPIEKKPLRRFHPGSNILSIGSYGCNMRCPFCQNHEISMSETIPYHPISPATLVELACAKRKDGNIGIAFTYNEPLISYEYVFDCAVAAKAKDLAVVIVSNGMIETTKLLALLPYVDAMNIDLKGFQDNIYEELAGNLEQVKETIRCAAAHTHVEITSLIVPRRNDAIADMLKQCEWLAQIDTNIPLHSTRYYPHYHQLDATTDIRLLERLLQGAKQYLTYVYKGNW